MGAEPHVRGRPRPAQRVLRQARAVVPGRPSSPSAPADRRSRARRNWRCGNDSRSTNRPAAGVITRRPEEPYTTSVRTVLWEPGRATAPATREGPGGTRDHHAESWQGDPPPNHPPATTRPGSFRKFAPDPSSPSTMTPASPSSVSVNTKPGARGFILAPQSQIGNPTRSTAPRHCGRTQEPGHQAARGDARRRVQRGPDQHRASPKLRVNSGFSSAAIPYGCWDCGLSLGPECSQEYS